jgi:hypothetical protein
MMPIPTYCEMAVVGLAALVRLGRFGEAMDWVDDALFEVERRSYYERDPPFETG